MDSDKEDPWLTNSNVVATRGNGAFAQLTGLQTASDLRVRDAERGAELERAAMPPNTAKAYRADWDRFTEWCVSREVASFEATSIDIADYVSALTLQGLKPSTISRRLAGVRYVLTLTGRSDNPTAGIQVRKRLTGYRREVAAPADKARALSVAELTAMISACPDTLAGRRDRAMLIIGFTGALRSAELVAIDTGHISTSDRGLSLYIPISKTDINAEGQTIALPSARTQPLLCPVKVWTTYMEAREAAGIETAAAFPGIHVSGSIRSERMTTRAFAMLLARVAETAGISTDDLSPHSLRSGYITAAALAGVSERRISNVTRHRTMKVLAGYVRAATLFDDVAVLF